MSAPEHDAAALRRLAQGLVLDGGSADAVQEAWLAALQRDGAELPRAGWLAGAVRRITLGQRRDQARRRARESAAARPDHDRGSEDLPERLEVLRALLSAVERLDEPYRGAVVMRYLDDLPPREIARRTGVPVATARTHVRRGLERLRADLDGPRGPGREALLGAFVPWFTRDATLGSVGVGGLAWMGGVAMKQVLGAAMVLIGVAVGWWWLREPLGPTGPTSAAAPSTPAALAPPNESDVEPHQDPLAGPTHGSDERVAVPTLRTFEVAGVILSGFGEPLPNGHVSLQVRRGPGLDGELIDERRLEADEGGEFRALLDAPTETVTVSLEQDEPGHFGIRVWSTVTAIDEPWGPWMVPAFPLDVELSGRVLDSEDRGVPGARVVHRVYMADREVRADAQGRFRIMLSSAAPSSRLSVRARGHASQRVDVARIEPGVIELPPIRLVADVPLRGRVLDQDGVPVAQAAVRDLRTNPVEWSETDETGSFELLGLESEAEYELIAVRHPDFAALDKTVRRDSGDPELRLERGFELRGRVRDASGAPVPGARLQLGSKFGPGGDPPLVSDGSGRFEFDGRLAQATYLWTWSQGHAGQRFTVDPPADGSDEVEVEITLEPERVLHGRLLLPDGSPKAWGLVYVEDAMRPGMERFDSLQTWSDRDGRYSVRGLPEGTVLVGSTVRGYARLEVELPKVPSQDVELRLQPSATLSGRVVDAATGAPVTAFTLRARLVRGPDGIRGPGGLSTTWTEHGVEFADADGRWSLGEGDLQPEAWVRVDVEAAGYAPGRLDGVPITADPGECVIALARSTRVVGSVMDPSGHPVAAARVLPVEDEVDANRAARRPEGRDHAVTDASGSFELAALPTGDIRLVVLAEGFATAIDGPFEVVGDATVRRDIGLSRGGQVHGRLLDHDGEPLTGERIDLSVLEGLDQGRPYRATTDERGAFAFEDLAPGTHFLTWVLEHGDREVNARLRLVEIEGDEEVEVDLQPSGTASVVGRVRFDGPMPAVAMVLAIPRPPPGASAPPGRYTPSSAGAFVLDGEFRIDGLPSGPHAITVHHFTESSMQSGSANVELSAGRTTEVEIVLRAIERSR